MEYDGEWDVLLGFAVYCTCDLDTNQETECPSTSLQDALLAVYLAAHLKECMCFSGVQPIADQSGKSCRARENAIVLLFKDARLWSKSFITAIWTSTY